MMGFRSDIVLPLEKAGHRFLEVLITKFLLSKSKKGYRLDVGFDKQNPTVWSDRGKRTVQKTIPNFKKESEAYQRELDNFLLTGKGKVYPFSDREFPFRYASGGTLPIIRRGYKEYYCFFYRDIYPIGWNIANGGCDSIHELLNPADTIERELREELIAFNPNRKEWLLLEAVKGEITDRLEMRAVRKLISNQFPHFNLSRFKTANVPLKWLDGPDELYVKFAKSRTSKIKGCFININAEDFGIEVDRIAYITIDPQTILIDGESWDEMVVNSPVGLFEVDRFHHLMTSGSKEFLPDMFFYNAKYHKDGVAKIKQVVNRYVRRMAEYRSFRALKQYKREPWPFELCPVTRRIVQRYVATLTEKQKGEFDIFISFASEDKLVARRVYKYLSQNSNKRIFFCEATLHDGNWANQINRALESAEKLILVGTSINNILKQFVQYEWSTFHLLILTEKKKPNLVPVMIGVDPKELPLPLRLYQGHFPHDMGGLKSCLPKLL